MRERDQSPGSSDLFEGHYTNYFEVGHNAFEFLLDFGQLYFEGAEGRMHTRIITSPVFAKRLAEVLNRALSEYEQTHGRVPEEADLRHGSRMGNMRHIHSLKNP
jgi:Protein of unknown function (DUF3467)